MPIYFLHIVALLATATLVTGQFGGYYPGYLPDRPYPPFGGGQGPYGGYGYGNPGFGGGGPIIISKTSSFASSNSRARSRTNNGFDDYGGGPFADYGGGPGLRSNNLGNAGGSGLPVNGAAAGQQSGGGGFLAGLFG